MQHAVNNPSPLTIFFVFTAGLITSLGPCSLSLLPVTIAYIGGSENKKNNLRILGFCSGVILSLVLLGAISGLFGKIYGQVPQLLTSTISLFAILMGLNLLGVLKFQYPNTPSFEAIKSRFPKVLAPLITGAGFGIASSPCITPVLATLLAWVSQTRNPYTSILFLLSFGIGQVTPLLIAGFMTDQLKNILEIRKFSQVIPFFSGIILLSLGILNIFSNWI